MKEITKEEKRIRIAEACGWKKCKRPGLPGLIVGKAPESHTGQKTHYEIEPRGDWWEIPDYFNNLNACHEMEKLLTESQFHSYLDCLDVSCGGELELSAMVEGSTFGFGLVHAAAAQRAEAFGKTLNLW